MHKSCLNCLYHGEPVSLTTPQKRPCGECIKTSGFSKWKLTDSGLKEGEIYNPENKLGMK